MKKMMMGMAVALVVLAGTMVRAEDAKSAVGAEKAPTACQKAGCNLCKVDWSKIGLTDEQKPKIEAALKTCKDAGCTPESKKALREVIKSTLTAEQKKALKAQTGCGKDGKAGCGKGGCGKDGKAGCGKDGKGGCGKDGAKAEAKGGCCGEEAPAPAATK